MAGVHVVGLKEAQRYLHKLENTAESADGKSVVVGSSVAYSYGIETGRHRSGRRARRAGGVFYLSRALAQVEPKIPQRISQALKAGKPAIDALLASGYDVEARAKALVVVVTGTLRRSILTRRPR